MRATLEIGLLTVVMACGGNGAATSPDADPNAPDAAPGMNIITGSVGGGSYNAAMTVLRAGAPDDNSTTVVFMFDHVVACSEIQATGWDKRVTNMTQALEIKMLGKTVKSYSVPTEASVNYTLTVQTGTPAESVSTTGTAALEVAVTDGSKAQGNFDVTFNNGHLAGRFDATFCPGGVEP